MCFQCHFYTYTVYYPYAVWCKIVAYTFTSCFFIQTNPVFKNVQNPKMDFQEPSKSYAVIFLDLFLEMRALCSHAVFGDFFSNWKNYFPKRTFIFVHFGKFILRFRIFFIHIFNIYENQLKEHKQHIYYFPYRYKYNYI